jgi:site-specific recombinase XerD
MLDYFFRSQHLIARLRGNPGVESLDAFAGHLSGCGYSLSHGARHLRAAAHLLHWLDGKRLSLTEVDAAAVNRFERHLGRCRCTGFTGMHRDKLLRGIRAFMAFQQGRPLCVSDVTQIEAAPSELWDSFCRWMREQRGTAERTLCDYRQYLQPLLAEIGTEPNRLNPTRLRRFILELGRNGGNARAKAATSALRTFIRFQVAQGQCPASLVDAIPSVAHWRLSSLPQYLQPQEVERVLVSADTQTPVGKRDRAILLLLARLGLRAGDVVQLRLTDIDWRSATITVSGKNRQQTQLPLTQEVGDAIVSYLQHGRAPTQSDRLFVRAIAPFRAFRDARGISDVAKLALRRAGVNAPQRGAAHVLRHSAATTMLRHGASLQEISTVLRHQSVASTQIYAKVDIVALHELAQPWPQVLPC